MAMRLRTDDYIKSLVRKVLREEGLLPPPVFVPGPDCEPRVPEDAGARKPMVGVDAAATLQNLCGDQPDV